MSPEVVSIIVAIVPAVATIATVLISNQATTSKIEAELDKHNAVQDERIGNLTEEVRRHNNFAVRIPKLEQRVDNLEKRMDRYEH